MWMTGNFNRDISIGIAYNMLIVRPISQDDFMSTIQHSGNYISSVIVKFKITIFFDDVSV